MSHTMLCNATLMVRLSNFYSSFKPNFSQIFCSSFKLFEHQTVRLSRVHCTCSFLITRLQTTSYYKDGQYIYKTMWQYLNMPETKLYACWNSEQNKFQKRDWLVQNLFFLPICEDWTHNLDTQNKSWGEYLETGENCMIRVFIICTLQAILLQLPNTGWAQPITARCALRKSKTENIKTF